MYNVRYVRLFSVALCLLAGRVYGGPRVQLDYYPLTPCRLLDTRSPAGPLGGPAVPGGGGSRTFSVSGVCGVPSNATALTLNVTSVANTVASSGEISVFPAGLSFDPVSTANAFRSGRSRAAWMQASIDGPTNGAFIIRNTGSVAVDVVVDVFGYFTPRPGAAVRSTDTLEEGVNIHGYANALFNQIPLMHLSWVRVDTGWRDIETNWGERNFGEFEALLQTIPSGVQVLVGFGNTPDWACQAGQRIDYSCVPDPLWVDPIYYAGGLTKYAAALHDFVEHFRGRVSAYSFGNERNYNKYWQGTPAQWYNYMFLPAAKVVRATDPNALIVAPDVSTSPGADVNWADYFYVLWNASAYFDVTAFHVYDGGAGDPNGYLGYGLYIASRL